jgi:hypothetical protein
MNRFLAIALAATVAGCVSYSPTDAISDVCRVAAIPPVDENEDESPLLGPDRGSQAG